MNAEWHLKHDLFTSSGESQLFLVMPTTSSAPPSLKTSAAVHAGQHRLNPFAESGRFNPSLKPILKPSQPSRRSSTRQKGAPSARATGSTPSLDSTRGSLDSMRSLEYTNFVRYPKV